MPLLLGAHGQAKIAGDYAIDKLSWLRLIMTGKKGECLSRILNDIIDISGHAEAVCRQLPGDDLHNIRLHYAEFRYASMLIDSA